MVKAIEVADAGITFATVVGWLSAECTGAITGAADAGIGVRRKTKDLLSPSTKNRAPPPASFS